jgi:hypothetical protein
MIEATERFVFTKDWITIIFVLLFGLFVLSKYLNPDRFSRLFSLIYSRNYLVLYQKQAPVLVNSFHIVFSIIQILTFALTIFIGIKAYNSIARELEFTFFLTILTGVFTFFVLRFFLGKALSVLFQREKDFEYVTYLKLSYLSNFSLLIFPLLLIAYYVQYDSLGFAFFVFILAVVLLLLYYALIIKNNQKMILKRLFYFILYLCALEIAPIILLYKLFIL